MTLCEAYLTRVVRIHFNDLPGAGALVGSSGPPRDTPLVQFCCLYFVLLRGHDAKPVTATEFFTI